MSGTRRQMIDSWRAALARTCWLVLLAILAGSNHPLWAAERIVLDGNGQPLTVARPSARIISLYSAHTENLCSLGAEEQLIGITPSDDYPASIAGKPRLSYRDDPEKFIGLHPDLVLVRPMIERAYPVLLGKLQQAGIRVVSLQPNSIEEMVDYWRTLGALTGREARAEAMVAEFNARLAANRERLREVPQARRPKVYFEAIHDKMKTFTPGSMAIFVLEQAGGINIGADAEQVRETNIAYYGKERLLSHGAEIEVFLAQTGRMNPVTRETILAEPGFAAIKAVREGRVYLIEEELVARPTLRLLDGIERLAAILYPTPAGTSGERP